MNKPPINGTVPPHQGQPLPRDWKTQAAQRASDANAAYLERLQNAWKGAASPASSSSPIQQARLRGDAADYPHQHSHPPSNGARKAEIRRDGELVLVESRADGWELWRDATTGSSIWRRIDWSDVFGKR